MDTQIIVAAIGFISGVAVAVITGILTQKNTRTQNQTQLEIARLQSEAAQFQAVLGTRVELIRERVPMLREHRTQQVRPFCEKAKLRAQLYYDAVKSLKDDSQVEFESAISKIISEAETLGRELTHLTVNDQDFIFAARDLVNSESAFFKKIGEIADDPANQMENHELTPDAQSRLINVAEEQYRQIVQYTTALNKAADEYIFRDDEVNRQLSELLEKEAESLQASDSASLFDKINSFTFKPKLRIRLPKDWSVKESITVLSPNGQANVIASSEFINKKMDIEKYVKQLGLLLQEGFKDYREIELKKATVFNGHNGYIRHFEWIPDDGLPVTQIQHYCYYKDRVYTATATTRLTDKEKYIPKLQRLIERLSIE